MASKSRVRRDLFVYLSGPMTGAHGYRVEDNVSAGLRVFFDCVARGIPAFSPHAIGAFPSTWEIGQKRWLAYDCAVIDRCTHVLMPGHDARVSRRARDEWAAY